MTILRIAGVSVLVLGLLIILSGAPSSLAEEPTVEWSYHFDPGIGSVSPLTDGFLYLGGLDGNVYAFQTAYGRPDWKYRTFVGVTSTPLYHDGTIYFGADDGQFYAVETKWGTQKWKFKAGASTDASPILYKDEVILVSGGKAYALDFNGTEMWNQSVGKEMGAWLTENDSTIYVTTSNGNVSALEPYYGGILWQKHVSDNAYSPLAYDGNIIVGTNDGTILALDQNSGLEKWDFKAGSVVSSSAVGSGDMVYAGAQDGYVYALDADNGSLIWKYRTGGPILVSPAIYKGVLYVGSGNGLLYALNAHTGDPGWTFNAGAPIRSAPVIDEGRIYFNALGGNVSGSTLYSLILPDYLKTSPASPIPEPTITVASDITTTPTTLPIANTGGSWCPLPGLMIAFLGITGIYLSFPWRKR